MCSNASTYGGNAQKAIIMGGSAGGNLAGAVSLKYSSQDGTDPSIPKPIAAMISVPSTIDPRALPEEYKSWWKPERYSDSAMIRRENMTQAFGTRSFILSPKILP
jgi:acetyl esterase/lipase